MSVTPTWTHVVERVLHQACFAQHAACQECTPSDWTDLFDEPSSTPKTSNETKTNKDSRPKVVDQNDTENLLISVDFLRWREGIMERERHVMELAVTWQISTLSDKSDFPASPCFNY